MQQTFIELAPRPQHRRGRVLTLDVDVGGDGGAADLVVGLADVGAPAVARKRRLEVEHWSLGNDLGLTLAVPAVLGVRPGRRVAGYWLRDIVHHDVHHLLRYRQALRWN